MSEEREYASSGLTVWFSKNLREIGSNPFDIKSEFGVPQAVGHGNSFDEADIYREALEYIVDYSNDPKIVEHAERALNATVRK